MLFIEVFKTIWDFSFWTENPAVAHEKYFYHLSKPLEFTDFPWFSGIFSNGPMLVHLAYRSINSHIFASKSSTTSSKLGLKSCFTTGPFLRNMAKFYGRALPQILALQQEYGLYREFSAVFIFSVSHTRWNPSTAKSSNYSALATRCNSSCASSNPMCV